jgi:pantoate kinase
MGSSNTACPRGAGALQVSAKAFAPGHITGFFEICDDESDPARIGSRGAGFSVKLGVTSAVTLHDEGWQGIEMKVNGEAFDAATTRAAVELLLGERKDVGIRIEQTMELPVSQGFGMSAAGALSASLAMAEILKRPRREAVWAAHCAEVMQRSGLGDVVGSALGGFEARTEPGTEPYGKVERFKTGEPTDDVILAVVDEAIVTKRILQDAQQRRLIKEKGAQALAAFQQNVGLRQFCDTSRRFSIESRLVSERINRVYNELERLAYVSQCMLGGAVFAFGRSAEVRQRLSRYGVVHQTKIDFEGARLLAA